MEQEIHKLQKDIISLIENTRRIQNFNDIPECLKIYNYALILSL